MKVLSQNWSSPEYILTVLLRASRPLCYSTMTALFFGENSAGHPLSPENQLDSSLPALLPRFHMYQCNIFSCADTLSCLYWYFNTVLNWLDGRLYTVILLVVVVHSSIVCDVVEKRIYDTEYRLLIFCLFLLQKYYQFHFLQRITDLRKRDNTYLQRNDSEFQYTQKASLCHCYNIGILNM